MGGFLCCDPVNAPMPLSGKEESEEATELFATDQEPNSLIDRLKDTVIESPPLPKQGVPESARKPAAGLCIMASLNEWNAETCVVMN